MLDTADQVTGFLVDFNHGGDVLTVGIEQRNVVFDEQALRGGDEFLFGARLIDVVVTGRDPHFVIEGVIEVFVRLDHPANQRRVA
ncbi:hypothetical protein D3C76_1494710 [compost metagenome]